MEGNFPPESEQVDFNPKNRQLCKLYTDCFSTMQLKRF